MSTAAPYYGTPGQRLLRPTKRLIQRSGLLRASQPRRTLIVSGVQRSGTNLVMDMLDTHWQTDVYHEWDSRAFDNYHMRPLAEVKNRLAASPSRRIVIKALLEADQVHKLLDNLAPARALWMLRDYEDTVNSLLRLFPGLGLKQMSQWREGSDIGQWRWRGMSDEAAQVLRAHDRPDLSDADGHALFWWYRNRLFFEQGLDTDTRVLALRYEDLAREPDVHCRRICDLAGIGTTTLMRRMPVASSIGKDLAPSLGRDIRALCEAMAVRLGAVAEHRQGKPRKPRH